MGFQYLPALPSVQYPYFNSVSYPHADALFIQDTKYFDRSVPTTGGLLEHARNVGVLLPLLPNP